MRAGWRRATGGWRRRHAGLRSAVLALLGLLFGAGPVAAQVQEVVEYYATDAVGSVRVVFNASGQVVARADYQPFGELFAPVGELPPQQFTGQARDGEAGLDYFGARFYQPRHGRFTQVDPVYAGLFDPQQWNRYTYARANPLSFVDPDGRQVQPTEAYRSDAIFWTQNNPVPPPPPPSLTVGVSYPGSASVVYAGPFGGLFAGDLGNVYLEDAGLGVAGGSSGLLETLRDVADVISVVDPTPVSNLLSAGASLGMGEVGEAAIAAVAAVPAIGAPVDAARALRAVRNLGERSAFLRQLGASGLSPKWMNQWLSAGRVPPGYNVDHIRPLSIGGSDSRDNMRLLLKEDHVLWHTFYHPWTKKPQR